MFLVKWREADGSILEESLSEKELGQKWVDMRLDIISVRPL
jgi:hypothetical protein